jgi:hypothetical protein
MPQIEYYMEVCLLIDYDAYPEERPTLTYPGCPAHFEINDAKLDKPSDDYIDECLAKEEDAIKEACKENEGERDIERYT